MNEKLQYRAMLDIPENTSSVFSKPEKKKKTKKKSAKIEDVKAKVIEKVNETTETTEITKNTQTDVAPNVSTETTQNQESVDTESVVNTKANANGEKVEEVKPTDMVDETNAEDNADKTAIVKSVSKKEKKGKKRLTLIKVQVAIIGALIGVILLTSVVNKNSGLNVFMRNVFAPNSLETVDERLYTDFAPVFSSSLEVVKDENGVITTSQTGSVYALVSGEVESVSVQENGLLDVTIKHSQNFSSKISGLKFVYLGRGDAVSTSLPLGYSGENGVSMCFMGENGEVIKDYTITENSVIWAV